MISSTCHCRGRTTRKGRVYKNATQMHFSFTASSFQRPLHHPVGWLTSPLRHSVREVVQVYQYRLSVSGKKLGNKELRDGVKDLIGMSARWSYVNLSRPTAAGVIRSYVNLSEAYGGRRNAITWTCEVPVTSSAQGAQLDDHTISTPTNTALPTAWPTRDQTSLGGAASLNVTHPILPR